MGIVRLLLKTNPIYFGKELLVSSIEEESLKKGYKKVMSETISEDVPVFNVVYNMGKESGKKDGKEMGYIRASNEYGDKFRQQAKMFFEQRCLFDTQVEEYNKLLDEYELRIMEYESLYGADINSLSLEEKEMLLNLLYEQRVLKQMDRVKVSEKKDKEDGFDMKHIKEKLAKEFKSKDNFINTYFDIKNLDKLDKIMSDYLDECVFVYDPSFIGNVFDKCKKGLVFGLKGILFLEQGNKYVKYEDICCEEIMYLPPALKIGLRGEKNLVCEGISYAQDSLISIIDRMCSYKKDEFYELRENSVINQIKILRKKLESAWKSAGYPGKLDTVRKSVIEWFENAIPEWKFSGTDLDDVVARFRYDQFNIIFTWSGFAFKADKEIIFILYDNIDKFEINNGAFLLRLVDGSIVEMDEIDAQFMYLAFKRIKQI